MFRFRIIFFIALLIIHFFSWAQTQEITNPRRNYDQKNFISINLPGLLIGDFPIYYERCIKRHFTIQSGLGITFGNTMYNTFVINGSNSFPFLVNNSGFDNNFQRTSTIGPSVMIEPKFYFGKKNYEGFYIGLEFRFRKYNYQSFEYSYLVSKGYNVSQDVYATIDLKNSVKEFRAVSDLLIEFGESHFIGKHLNFQYFIGLGLRNNAYYSASISDVIISSTQQISSYQINSTHSNSQNFALTHGFRFGYVF